MTDVLTMMAIQALLVGLLLASAISGLYGNWKAWRASKSGLSAIVAVKRGPESRKKFGLAYGFASVLLLELIGASSSFAADRVLLSVADMSAVFYLCFFSAWFRSLLIGRLSAWEDAPEQ